MEGFTLASPTIERWLEIIKSQRQVLLNPKPQMTTLLTVIQQDIDKQFDENQSKWARLAAYTVKKKQRINADPRILHQTREGQGVRLRDAYKKAGEVSSTGKLTFSYPEEKPYAKDHQTGLDTGKKEKKKSKISPSLARELKHLDDEFYRKIRD